MGRPTDEKKDKVIKVRISEDLYDELMKKGGNLSATIRNLLRGNVPPEEKKGECFVPQNDELADIRQMAKCFHVETEELLRQVCEGLNEGYLTCEGGKVKGIPEIDLTDFYDVCHELRLRPQEALNKMVQNMRRGK